jgi:hypothetical protein
MIDIIKEIIKEIIKSLHWFPGFMLGSCLYLFFKEFKTVRKMKRHYKKKDSDFHKKYFPEEKE